MAAKYDLTDDRVVVVIGSGAGGGTVASELALESVDTVLLEGRNHFLPWNSADVVRASVQQALAGGC